MTWYQKLWRWLKVAAAIIVGILATILAIKIVGQAIKGKVASPHPWAPVPGRTDQIDVQAPWGTERTALPAGMSSDMKLSVEAVQGGPVKVEVRHAATDRRSMLPAGG